MRQGLLLLSLTCFACRQGSPSTVPDAFPPPGSSSLVSGISSEADSLASSGSGSLDKWSCETASDCVNTCFDGAVSVAWRAVHERFCADGCANQLAAPPRCLAGRCVAFSHAPSGGAVSINPGCTFCGPRGCI